MRLLNIFAALSGVVALAMLTIAAHVLRDAGPEAIERIKLGGFVQMGAACAGLAIANRVGRLNVIAGSFILAGAALFAGALYTISLSGSMAFATLAPVGGITLILGWIVLAFAKPGT